MKRVNYFLAAALVGVATAFSACNNEDSAVSPTISKQDEVTPALMQKFTDLGFDAVDMQIVNGNYILEGDILITPEQLASMKGPTTLNGPSGEQYRTYNLVSTPRTITVNGEGVSKNLRIGLNDAIKNYNDLGLSIKFKRVKGKADITLTESGEGGGAVAGFPTDSGNPYNTINFNTGIKNLSRDVIEHIVTHEMGHCIGMRHSDWFDRSLSCGRNEKEGSAPYGALLLDGTPSGYDPNSIMKACYGGTENGEFSNYDEIGLKSIY